MALTLTAGCAMEVDGDDDAELEEIETGANLLANQGFEAPVKDDRCDKVSHWECNRDGTWGLHGAGAVRMEGARRVHGEGQPSRFGVRMTATGAGEYAAQVVPVRGGGIYRFRTMFRPRNGSPIDGPGFGLNVAFLDRHGEQIGPSYGGGSPKQLGAWWKDIFDEIDAPAAATHARVMIFVGPGNYSYDFDDVVFAPLD